jgi:hypothetical protein
LAFEKELMYITNMELMKAKWSTDGDNFTIHMPLSKIDKEKRTVSGWASLDNPDLQGDIVLAEASQKAFARFKGNIREMHQPIAVGRMLSYRPDSYYDSETQKFYNGIWVDVYVSKGAESTWEKVLDGTLSMFSIAGPIIDSEMEFSKDAGRPLRIVKDYDLNELSLVDSGGNQLAHVMSFAKDVNGGLIMKGMMADNPTENVFYCDKHEEGIAKTTTDDSAECPEGHKMKSIGWFEYSNDVEKATRVAEVIAEFKKEIVNDEGGVDVADEKIEKQAPDVELNPGIPADEEGKAATEVEASAEENAETTEEAPVEETVAETAEATPEVAEEQDFEKMFDDLKGAITEGIKKSEETARAEREAQAAEFAKKFEDMHTEFAELKKSVEGIKSEIDSVEKRLGSVESDTAIKKSGDLGGSTGDDKLEKSNKSSKWGGHFLNASELD